MRPLSRILAVVVVATCSGPAGSTGWRGKCRAHAPGGLRLNGGRQDPGGVGRVDMSEETGMKEAAETVKRHLEQERNKVEDVRKMYAGEGEKEEGPTEYEKSRQKKSV
jgi:hypothetical protein